MIETTQRARRKVYIRKSPEEISRLLSQAGDYALGGEETKKAIKKCMLEMRKETNHVKLVIGAVFCNFTNFSNSSVAKTISQLTGQASVNSVEASQIIFRLRRSEFGPLVSKFLVKGNKGFSYSMPEAAVKLGIGKAYQLYRNKIELKEAIRGIPGLEQVSLDLAKSAPAGNANKKPE